MVNIVIKIRKLIIFVLFNLVAVILLFALGEGLASLTLFVQMVSGSAVVAERSHTQYDPELGWVNRPNLLIKDLYGPGLDLQTNSQGFRNREDFSQAVPPDKVRVICSGDSFTLGYGVGNDQTWCQLLASLDPRFQPVNMGQGGYGVDQAYLWYKRDGLKLDHDLQLFAFITTDFERMEQREFLGYGKPHLTLTEGQLGVENVPVPERAFFAPWLTQNREAIQRLRSMQLLSQFFQAEVTSEPLPSTDSTITPPEKVAAAILKELLALNAQKGSTLVLVYLPTLGDYEVDPQSSTERWRAFLKVATQDTGVIFIDLIEPFRDLPLAEAQRLFIPEGAVVFPGATGHYSVGGNQYIAQSLYEALSALPVVTNRLAEVEP